jgi:hypothetical protein
MGIVQKIAVTGIGGTAAVLIIAYVAAKTNLLSRITTGLASTGQAIGSGLGQGVGSVFGGLISGIPTGFGTSTGASPDVAKTTTDPFYNFFSWLAGNQPKNAPNAGNQPAGTPDSNNTQTNPLTSALTNSAQQLNAVYSKYSQPTQQAAKGLTIVQSKQGLDVQYSGGLGVQQLSVGAGLTPVGNLRTGTVGLSQQVIARQQALGAQTGIMTFDTHGNISTIAGQRVYTT